MRTEKNRKLFTLLSLYVAQSIPMSFFSTVIPVIMRQQNYSLEMIGLMQLIKLPWIIKFLWAPMVDRSAESASGYRRWIFYSEAFYALCIMTIAFFNPENHIYLIVIMIVVAVGASATQDIATDAWAILMLEKKERSMGNSMQSMGSFIGSMAGSGILLIVYHWFGWKWLLLSLSAIVVLAVLPLGLFKPRGGTVERTAPKKVSFKDIGGFFKIKGTGSHLLLIILFTSSLTGIMTMVKPMMIDLGYTVRDIGIVSGIMGTSAGVAGACLAGFLMQKLAKERVAVIFALFNFFPALFFIFTLPFAEISWIIYSGVALLWAAYAMGMVFIFTISMLMVRPFLEGTDFTLQIVAVQLFSLFIAVFSGKIADAFSYSMLFNFSLILAAINFLVTIRYAGIKFMGKSFSVRKIQANQ